MVSEVESGMAVPVATGAALGVITFLGLVVWFGMPLIPTTANLPSILPNQPSPYASVSTGPQVPLKPGEQTYQTICAACHQANAQGLPGAFPPLAGSEWVNGDVETMVRIVIAGLSGPVTVKGAAFNSMMPPPPGLDDEKIADVVTFVRSNFGNKAPAVDVAAVKAIRASIASRTTPWTADELKALQKPGDAPAAPK